MRFLHFDWKEIEVLPGKAEDLARRRNLGATRNIVSFTGGDLACNPEWYAQFAEEIKTNSALNKRILELPAEIVERDFVLEVLSLYYARLGSKTSGSEHRDICGKRDYSSGPIWPKTV
ncbi:MAG: hypothetical protein QW421_06970 [Archaeoglobaceae archaeon]